MSDLERAINMVKYYLAQYIPEAKDVHLECVLNSIKYIEVSLSYTYGVVLPELNKLSDMDGTLSCMVNLISVMRTKREHKVFLIPHSVFDFMGY